MNYEKAKKYLTTKTHIKEVFKFLTKASEAYYNTESKILSDVEYDELATMYNKITGETIIGANPIVGSKTVSVDHSYQNLVGTLDKATNLDEVDPFLKRFSNVKLSKYKIRLSLKFDGNSVTIEYNKDGTPKKALTRGKDGKGKDIINVFKDDKIDVDSQFNLSLLDSEFAIKYEAIINYENFDKLCEETGEDYANPRSTASGLLNSDDGYKFRKYITLVPLEMRVLDEGFAYEGKYKKLYLEELHEAYPINYFSDFAEIVNCSSLKEVKKKITEYYNKVNKLRPNLPFMIDGIVVEMLNKEIIQEYFYDPRGFIPQHNFAVKLPSLEKISEVTDIDYCVGTSGRITPRIHFKKVEFNGTEHTKQQISNYKRFKELNLGIGSKVLVTYRNDCLSYITKLEEQPEGIKPFEFIKKCPICNGDIKITKNDDGVYTLAHCSNPKCPGKLKGKIENYLIKMDIKGIKSNIIEKLYENKIITNIPSLYSINYEKVKEVLGPKMAENIKKAIEEKEYYDYEILGSLGIQNFSLESAKLLCKEYNLEEIIDLINSNNLKRVMKNIEGFNDKTIQYVIKGIIENAETIEFLGERGYHEYKEKVSNSTNLNIAVTGWRPDSALTMKMEMMGITVKSSVSKKVNILVYSGQPGATKTNKAKELGIQLMSIDDFKKAYNL